MRLTDDTVRDLSLLAYEAASGDDWSPFLEELVAATGSVGLNFYAVEPWSRSRGLMFDPWGHSAGFDPALMQEYMARWVALDPWIKQADALGLPLPTGHVNISDEYLSRRQLLTTEFYSDFGRRAEAMSLASLIVANHRQVGSLPTIVLSLVRGSGQPFFSAEHKQLLSALHGPLYRALRANWAFRRSHNMAFGEGASTALDATPQPTWLLDAKGRVLHANLAASGVADVSLKRGALVREFGQLTEPRWTALLRCAVAGEVAQAGLWFSAGTALRTAVLRLMPLPPQHQLRLTWPQAAVLMQLEQQDSALDHATRLRALAQRCGFTVTEAKVLRELCAGATLEQIATHGGLRITTVRTHVKHLMEKAGVSRQVDLVRLVAGM